MADDFPLPSGYVKIAIENGHRNSGFSQLENGGSFQFAMLVITRGYKKVNIFKSSHKLNTNPMNIDSESIQHARFYKRMPARTVDMTHMTIKNVENRNDLYK